MNLSEFIKHVESVTHTAPIKSGDGYTCRCPAHDDKSPSLSISEGADGRVLIKCHAGCSFESVIAALRLSASDLFSDKNRGGRPRKVFNIVATYPYRDKAGKLLFEVCRMDPKDFRQRRPDPSMLEGWAWNLKGVRQVPFRLPELIAAVKSGDTVFIAEGEKDVEALAKHGFTATCNAGGAEKWRDEFGEYFDGAKAIVVIADKDAPGRKHAVSVAKSLTGIVPSVKTLELPDMAERTVKDAHDFFAAGGTSDQLRKIAEMAKEFEPPIVAAKLDNNAETVTSSGLICVNDEAKLSTVPLYYYAEKSSWYAPDNRGGFFKTTCAAAQSFLAAHGFSKVFKDSQGNSPAESALFWKMQSDAVAYAGELAGYPAGCHEINGRRILVTHSPQMVLPTPGEFPNIARLIETMLAYDEHQQTQMFFAWLASSYVALRERLQNPSGAVFRFAPALYLAGPRECGKSALIKLVLQPLFGGRMADPTNYLKDSKFNKDLFAASLLIMDDKGASSNLSERRQRGEGIKSLIWNEEQRMEGKGADAIILTPFRRLVIASNDDEAGLQICPALSPSLRDKLLILRARRADGLPKTHAEQYQWAKCIRAELPAFAHWLLQFELSPVDCEISERTRLPIFQHPDIVSALYDLQPEMRLLELIDLFNLIGIQPCWEGFATDFEQTMRERDDKHLLDRIFVSGTTAGRMLTELSRMCPERVTITPRGGKSFYRIFPAPETNPTKPT